MKPMYDVHTNRENEVHKSSWLGLSSMIFGEASHRQAIALKKLLQEAQQINYSQIHGKLFTLVFRRVTC